MKRSTRCATAALSVLVLLLVTASAAMAAPDQARNGTVSVIATLADQIGGPWQAADQAADQIARDHGAGVGFVYEHALRGFSAQVPEGRLRELARDPRVGHLEVNQRVTVSAQEVPTGIRRILADGNAHVGIDGSDDTRVDADVAIIDTGIDLDHPDLAVNLADSVDCLNHSGGPPFDRTYTCEPGGDDDNGHGTHLAGTVGALDNDLGVVGVAPGARVWAVKVLDAHGSGALSAVMAGIDYVTANADTIDVANMSLGCKCSSAALDEAIAASVAAGVTYAVAAGNSHSDAKTFSPANHPDVITVSALADFDGEPGGDGDPTCRDDQDDTLADFSNFGDPIDIAAPGVCIRSTVPGGGYDTFSGTSMATPHAAGAAALLAASGATEPDAIRQTLIAEGNLDWNDDSGDDVQEPLLDVSDPEAFDPALTDGSGDGGDGGGDDGGDIALGATGYKTRGLHKADLTWSGAPSGDVDVHRDGAVITTTTNDGAYTDDIDNRGGGSYTYQVCEADTSTCSNEATVTF